MSDNKEIIVSNIKEWVLINNKITAKNLELKKLKDAKKIISEKLIKIMENNEIDEFDINNNKLVHKKTKVKGTINKNYLLSVLGSYFEKNNEIDNEDLTAFILDNRPIKENSSLVIKENK
tara:strand:+ start:180 stop:539 length:360 start_codon:yes stop_codon:yes gene_type:complete